MVVLIPLHLAKGSSILTVYVPDLVLHFLSHLVCDVSLLVLFIRDIWLCSRVIAANYQIITDAGKLPEFWCKLSRS